MAASTDDIIDEVRYLTKQVRALISDIQKYLPILDRLEKSEKKRTDEADKKNKDGEF